MNQASNDNQRGYDQAVLVLIYEQREEYREVFAVSINHLKRMTERIYHENPDLISIGLWFEDEKQAWVYNGPRSNG
jgi:hypothetical protein